MEMDEEGRNPEHKFANVEFQNFPTDYHSWSCPVFLLEAPLQGGPASIANWEPRSSTGFYLRHYHFHAVSLSLVLNKITWYVNPKYHMVFENTLSTVDHTRKGTEPGKRKSMVEEHSELSTQDKFTLEKE